MKEGREQFLFSAKTTPAWKPIYLREATQEDLQKQRQVIFGYVPQRLHEFDRNDSVVIPDYFLHPDDLVALTFPEPERTVQESLEEAYYRKHFILPPEGAVIHIRQGGDLETFTLKEKGRMLWAKVTTPNGEHLLGLNLDSATLDTKEWRKVKKEDEMEDRLAKVLALVYRDMVVSDDVLISSRSSNSGNDEDPSPLNEYRWVYIPRRRRILTSLHSTDDDIEGVHTRKSPKVHKVSGFKRKGNISARHLSAIRAFEQETNLRILDSLPEGYTFVRPHVSPKGSLEEELAKLPSFIKRKIETELSNI